MSGDKRIVIGLAGNPNAGKTSLFNKLTGLRAHVGNYPGVTVEQKWGELSHRGRTIKVVDLPGTYSLNSYSLDERVARDFLINERPDLAVNVIDTTNLERNLYLTLQFLELGLPVVLAMNMMDLSSARGISINMAQLEAGLGVKAVPIVATSGKGLEALLDKALETADEPDRAWRPLKISYGPDIDEAIEVIEEQVKNSTLPARKMPARWLAVKCLEGDPAVGELFAGEASQAAVLAEGTRKRLAARLRLAADDELAGLMTDRRYGFLAGLCRAAITRTRQDVREISDAIDKILLNRLLAPVFFLAVVYGLYEFTFWASGPVVGWLESFFEFLGETAGNNMRDGLLKDLVLEGLIGGVGGVLGFAPLIAFMFIGISILEDSGYMARAAFILDRVFRAFGLHGNSVTALIVGGGIAGGCAIPGVMATRTLRDPKERIATILVAPFMTCGAKLPVFMMIANAFFSENAPAVMMGLTVFGWAAALVSAKILRIFVLPGQPAPFVLELPPYRRPTFSGVLLHAWERTWSYVKKAGAVIVGVTVVIWLMMTFPKLPEEQKAFFEGRIEASAALIENARNSEGLPPGLIEALEKEKAAIGREESSAGLRWSLAGKIGQALEPLSRLIGFDWRANIALVGGFAAKEVVLSTLGTAYAIDAGAAAEGEGLDGEETLRQRLGERLASDAAWSPLAAVSLMVFVLIYAPCFVTIVVIYREIGLKWAVFSLIGSTVYAYLICLALYQGGGIFV
ncbi:MAG: ferrous iron transport protein B [Candidatus Adiutrix sp.]|jgi:ferrous iron transport protein B|nr:ferrous iron transport protein B [Candidatus Adiutrix sp.]